MRHIREVEAALGSYEKNVVESESDTVILQRRSLFAARDIPANKKISVEDIAVLRPQKGLLPKYKPDIIGLPTKKSVKKGDPITWNSFK